MALMEAVAYVDIGKWCHPLIIKQMTAMPGIDAGGKGSEHGLFTSRDLVARCEMHVQLIKTFKSL